MQLEKHHSCIYTKRCINENLGKSSVIFYRDKLHENVCELGKTFLQLKHKVNDRYLHTKKQTTFYHLFYILFLSFNKAETTIKEINKK